MTGWESMKLPTSLGSKPNCWAKPAQSGPSSSLAAGLEARASAARSREQRARQMGRWCGGQPARGMRGKALRQAPAGRGGGRGGSRPERRRARLRYNALKVWLHAWGAPDDRELQGGPGLRELGQLELPGAHQLQQARQICRCVPW